MKKTILLVSVFLFAITLSAQQETVLKIYRNNDSTKIWDIKTIEQISFKTLNQGTRLNLFLKKEPITVITIGNIDSIKVILDNSKNYLRLFLKDSIRNVEIASIDSITFTTIANVIAKIDTTEYKTEEKIVLKSAYQDTSTQIDDQFKTIVSTVGTQLLFVLDNNQQLRGLTLSAIRNNEPEIQMISAKSTAYALLMMTPGILTTNPDETEIVLKNFDQLQSMQYLINYLKSNMPVKTLTAILIEEQTNVLVDSCISEYISKYQSMYIQRKGDKKQGDEGYFIIDTKKEGSENIIEFKNFQWRYVKVIRRDLDKGGNEKNVVSIIDGMGGATSLSWGSILGMTDGDPTIAYDKKYKLGSDILRSQYWIFGPGCNYSDNVEPPSTVEDDYINEYGYTMLHYLVLPLVDILVGAGAGGDQNKLVKSLWSLGNISKSLFEIYKKPTDKKTLAKEMTNSSIKIFKECLEYDFFVKELIISKITNGILKKIFWVSGFAISAANVSILINRMYVYPEHYYIEKSNPDFVQLKINKTDKTSAIIGDEITITGTNFGTTRGSSIVSFTGANASASDYKNWSATSITVKVPAGAETGKISVTVSGTKSNEVDFIVVPFIASISKNSGTIGYELVITGTGFDSDFGKSFVSFNGANGNEYTWSATTVKVNVPEGAKTGSISVTVGGQKSNQVDFVVIPKIITIDPPSAKVGEKITINGSGFVVTDQGTSYVTIGDVKIYYNNAEEWNSNKIVVIIPDNIANYKVSVTVDNNKSNEVVLNIKSFIADINPKSGYIGTEVVISGTGFGDTRGTNFVSFGSVKAEDNDYNDWTSTLIKVKVPAGSVSGKVSITTNNQKSNDFDFVVLPYINNPNPASAQIGADVTITGTNFGSTRGSSIVSFTGADATEYTWSATSIIVKVPSGALTGNVSVTVGGNKSNERTFTVYPYISGINPNSAQIGADITITGTNFGSTRGSSIVSFSGANATEYTWSATSITVKVPSGATTGNVSVTVSGNKSNERTFTVYPYILSINPSSAQIGADVTITGTNFGSTRGSSIVSFTGADASNYSSWSTTSIMVKVPSGAISGNLSVTVGGNKSNERTFTVETASNPDEVTIGSQVWMTKNLDVAYYRNGDAIPQVTSASEWASLTTGAWCYYNNDANNNSTYGKLYNWYAVNDTRGLAPSAWHVPSDAEWSTLTTYLGGESIAGGELKEAGTSHWNSPNGGATNESGFSALPGGCRNFDGTFASIGNNGYWWSSTEYNAYDAWVRVLNYGFAGVDRGYVTKDSGFSVRCVRD